MLFGSNRDELRQFYCDSWDKYKQNKALEPLEKQLVNVIQEHPEYHALLENRDKAKSREYLPEMNETNPFLHMSMHLGIREQVDMNQPAGIGELLKKLILKEGEHEAEHKVMDCLAEAIMKAQSVQSTPDNSAYLDCIKMLVQDLK